MEKQHPALPAKRIDPNLAPLVSNTKELLTRYGLNTICDSGHCPNMYECYSRQTVTFMIMGDVCSRNCGFCSVKKGKPQELDVSEPERVAEAVKELGLKHVVITSVTRDDQDDCGVYHFVETIQRVRRFSPDTIIEVLIPDFKGVEELVEILVHSRPDIIGHNLETIARLHFRMKSKSSYYRSLTVLNMIKEFNPGIYTKSGIMLGLGENQDDVILVIRELKKVNCDILVLGQYLRPTKEQVEVKRIVPEEEYEEHRKLARTLGFSFVVAGPYVRSSYMAAEFSEKFIRNRKDENE